MNSIRLLRHDEIECRVGMINEKGLSLLLYKDARADMKILDEIYGPMNWQRKHELIGDNLYCVISIWDEEKKQWISKMDVGTESYTEKAKGQASDSFKRACVSVGIGRELYSAPFIWIPASRTVIQKRGDKFCTNDRFSVQKISYNNNREITSLVIINKDGNIVYTLTAQNKAKSDFKISDRINAINSELERTGVTLEAVLKHYGVSRVEDMTPAIYNNAISSLRKMKNKAA